MASNYAASSEKSRGFKNPPVLTSNYRKYKKEVELWSVCCKLEKSEKGPALALSLPEGSVREKVIEELGVTKLAVDDGIKVLLNFLDKFLLKDEFNEAYDRYVEFDSHVRSENMSMEDYIMDFQRKYQQVKGSKVVLPESILAFRMLDKANLEPKMKQLVVSGVDYEDAENQLSDQMACSLRKFCGKGIMTNSNSRNSDSTSIFEEPVVKIEESFYSRNSGYRQPPGKRFNNTQNGPPPMGMGRGSPRHNRVGEDGKPMRCHICGSVFHFASRCPEKSNAPRMGTSYGTPSNSRNWRNFSEVNLFTGGSQDELLYLVQEAKNAVVLDSGCPTTVTGKVWLSMFLETLGEDQKKSVQWTNSDRLFKFGPGTAYRSTGCVTFPCMMGMTKCRITADVVDCDIPMLFGRESMKKAGTVLHLDEDRVTMFGEPMALEVTSSGHYCLPLTSQCQSDVMLFTLEGDLEKKVEKLHKQFSHPSEQNLVKLLGDAGCNNGESLVNIVRKVSESCAVCKLFKKTPPRPVTCMPLAKDFNDVLTMDLKFWRPSIYFMHMIDAATRFSKSVVIRDKRPATIIEKFMVEWVGTFGRPQKVLFDNGGEFSNTEFLNMAQSLGTEVLTTPAYSPWSNGLCERNHCVIDENVSKLLKDNPQLSLDCALIWACNAKNSLAMVYGYSPYQLVFGRNPNLPSVLTAKLPALDNDVSTTKGFGKHLEALHASREAFIQSEASDRIRRALRGQTRNHDQFYEPGDSVFYQRNGKWNGPGKVIGQDGKVVLVRHGGMYVRVHPCRLNRDVKIRVEEDQSTLRDHVGVESSSIDDDDDDAVYYDCKNDTRNDDDDDFLQPAQTLEHATPADQANQQLEQAPEPPIAEQLEPHTVMPEPEQPPRRNLRQLVRPDYRKLHEVGTTVFSVLIPRAEQNSEDCLVAKQDELEKLKKFDTYEMVDDQGQPSISTRWVMSMKEGKPRARLVARGFEDKTDVQRDSPTVGKTSIRLFLALASCKDWMITTTDIKSAFLQGQELTRDVFIKPPKEASVDGKLWRLKRCLYGLNDAARQFFLSVSSELKKLKCTQSRLDPSVYYNFSDRKLSGILLSHVDDFLHAGDKSFQFSVMEPLCRRFIAGKVEKESFSYVGFQIRQTDDGIYIDMNEYVDSIEIPKLDPDRETEKNDQLTAKELTMYRSVIGNLNWIVQGVRPDLAYELTALSMKSQTALVKDLIRGIKLLGSVARDENSVFIPKLKNTPDQWKIVVCTDASLANQGDHVSSTYGLLVFLVCEKKCVPLSWRSGRIRRVVRSTLAAEALALVEGLEEAVCLRTLLCEMIAGIEIPITGIVDNKSLVESVHSSKLVDDRKLRIELGQVKEMLNSEEVHSVVWCPGAVQLANSLTKVGADGTLLRKVLRTGVCSFVNI